MHCIANRWLSQGTNLASSLKTMQFTDKCNCQNKQSLFAVHSKNGIAVLTEGIAL